MIPHALRFLTLERTGHYLPQDSDSGSSGDFITDFYWGIELHPVALGISVKQMLNCRFGMMSWSVLLFSYMAKQYELYGKKLIFGFLKTFPLANID